MGLTLGAVIILIGPGAVDSARLMTLVAVALNDAIIAVLDAKYHYNFWPPITAIRKADIEVYDAFNERPYPHYVAITAAERKPR